MKTTEIDGIEIAYEKLGSGSPLLLLTGLGGVGRSWGDLIERFAARFTTIVPDHRGTGRSAKPRSGYTIEALAADMAGLVRKLGHGPAHVVGSSTGGAIGQVMTLDHPESVRSLTLVSSWAGRDRYFVEQFELRKSILAEQGTAAYSRASSLFLFAPSVAAQQPEMVGSWLDKALDEPGDPEIMRLRIDMILDHDQRGRLEMIDVPTLVVMGDEDICTPPHMSRELAAAIPGARLAVIPGGHFVHKERPDEFFWMVSGFLADS